jgi:Tfp pilus assembly protein PilP
MIRSLPSTNFSRMNMVRLINHLLAITIVSIISCVSVASHAQEIPNGSYIGHNRGVVTKYIIMKVSDNSILLEMFTRW